MAALESTPQSQSGHDGENDQPKETPQIQQYSKDFDDIQFCINWQTRISEVLFNPHSDIWIKIMEKYTILNLEFARRILEEHSIHLMDETKMLYPDSNVPGLDWNKFVVVQVDFTMREDGLTPLVYAAWSGHLMQLNLLIKWGANVDQKLKNGNTSLMEAVLGQKTNRLQIIESLVRAKAKVNEQNKMGHTVFTVAALYKDLVVLKYLYETGRINIDHTTQMGNTALTMAVAAKSLEAIKYLVGVGINIMIENKNDWTAVCWASKLFHAAVTLLTMELGLQHKLVDFVKRRTQVAKEQMEDRTYFKMFKTTCIMMIMLKPSRNALLNEGSLEFLFTNWQEIFDEEKQCQTLGGLLPWIVALSCSMMYEEGFPMHKFIQCGADFQLLMTVETLLHGAGKEYQLAVQAVLVPIMSTVEGLKWIREKAFKRKIILQHFAALRSGNLSTVEVTRVFNKIMDRQFAVFKAKDMQKIIDKDLKSLCPLPRLPVKQKIIAILKDSEPLYTYASDKLGELNIAEDLERNGANQEPKTKRQVKKEMKKLAREKKPKPSRSKESAPKKKKVPTATLR